MNDRVYTFVPVSTSIKVSFTFLTATMCIFGVGANAFALACKLDDLRARKTRLQVAFRRQVLCFLMISLSTSDIITALLGGGTLTVNFLADVFQTEWPCKISRFVLVFTANISVNNLLLISVEKYLGIFYWKKLPSELAVRWGILFIWLEALLASFASFLLYGSVRINLDDRSYTLICDVITNLPYSQASFIGTLFFAYFIPAAFVCYAAVAIAHNIRLSNKNVNTSHVRKQQLRNAQLFVDIIVGFVLPYALIIFYRSYRVLSQRKFSFVAEYIYRYISMILVVSNCVINPIIYYTRCRRYRKKIKAFWHSLNCVRNLVGSDEIQG